VSFLAPLWLALAGAVAVPLLLHLMRRRIGTRVEFPAARYLARAEQEHSRQLRLRNLLLMMLRVLAVLLVALAAARPATRWLGGGHGQTALAIVLDNSLSTSVVVNGRPLYDELEEIARATLREARPDDRVWLVTADGAVRSGTPAALERILDDVGPIGGAGDLRAAATRAAAAVRSAGLPSSQVAVITDAQRSAWEAAVPLGDVEVLLYVPSSAPPANRSVAMAEARPGRWTPRGTVAARIASPDSAAYRIVLGGRDLTRGTVAPGEAISLRAAPPERGWTAGAVELEPDELRGDDVRHFAAWIGPTPTVAVSPAAGAFVRSAVDVLAGAGRVTTGTGIAVLAADELVPGSLPALLLAPSDPVRVGAANRALERAGIPWRFGPPRREAVIARFAPGGALDTVTVLQRYDLVAQGGEPSDTIATVGAGAWIVGGARYVLVASPVAPEATSLPVRAAFVPWLAETFSERLSGEPGRAIAAAPTAVVPRPRWADGMEDPSGARTPIAGERITAPATPGVHFLTRAGRRVGALVVNPPGAESALERLPTATLSARLEARRVRVASDRASWNGLPFRGAPSRSLVPLLLALALAVLVVEAFAVRAAPRAA
jgi:hypothetical protein